jgi:hypothetical protein
MVKVVFKLAWVSMILVAKHENRAITAQMNPATRKAPPQLSINNFGTCNLGGDQSFR